MIKAYRGVHIKYKLHLEEEKKKQVLSDYGKQMLHLSPDIDHKVRQIGKEVTMMDEKAFEGVCLAEQKNELSYVIQYSQFDACNCMCTCQQMQGL